MQKRRKKTQKNYYVKTKITKKNYKLMKMSKTIDEKPI